MKEKEKVFVYDTTLRDGAAREGISLTVEDKVKILLKLDEFGIDYVECGYPASNPKEAEFFRRIATFELDNAIPVAFGSTRRALIPSDDDASLRSILEAGTATACIFGKSWDFHVKSALKTTLDENLWMIADSVEYLKKRGIEVIYDAEHFFDAYNANPEYALKTIKAAEDAGADWIVLCDTNGGMLPSQTERIVEEVFRNITIPLGMHAHNDTECAVANTLIAVERGAKMVQGTINGYGERCGNANLCSVMANISLKMDIDFNAARNLSSLTEMSHYVSEIANITPDSHQPFVGQSAFAHKGGAHVSAVVKESSTYEHIDPNLVGNMQKIVVSEISGRSTIVLKAKELGKDISNDVKTVEEILSDLKDLEHVGYQFEAADGSFELLLRKKLDLERAFFKLESFRVIMEKREDGRIATEATIKIHVKGRRIIATGEGNGPVNALDNALRQAIGEVYPALEDIKLTDFKVRVLDEKKGTGAITRVLIETGDGEKTWGTIGVSENIIEASWKALVDSITYGLIRKESHSA